MRMLFHARSPFWPFTVMVLFFVLALFSLLRANDSSFHMPGAVIVVMLGAMVLIALAYGVQLLRYNIRNPQNRIRYWGLVPPELKEEDEGAAAFTLRAVRRVYVFHSTALPLTALLMFYTGFNPFVVLGGMALLCLGHLTIYWVSIWPLWQAELAADEE